MENNINQLDKSLFLKLNGEHHQVLDLIMSLASNKLTLIPVFLVCSYVVIKYFKRQKETYHPSINYIVLVSILCLQFVLCFYILPDIFKSLFNMPMPCANPEIAEFVRLVDTTCKETAHSFFSYRACLVLCFTSFLFFIIKDGFWGIKWLLVIWCLLVSYSRVYVGAYFPTNILLSNIIGIVLGYLGYRFYFYLRYNLLVI